MDSSFTVYFLPVNRADWRPSVEWVQCLLEHLEIESVFMLSGSSRREFWNEELLGPDLFFDMQVEVQSALEQWRTRKPLVLQMSFGACAWSKRVSQELRNLVPPDIHGDCSAWMPTVLVGPWSMRALDRPVTAAEGNFYFALSSNGQPGNGRGLHRALEDCQAIQEQLAWLEQQTGFGWKLWSSVR